jgi:hypothetical protein
MPVNESMVEEFEKEMWLYVSGELPEVKTTYWNEQIKSSNKLKSILEESLSTIEKYNESLVDIDNSAFNRMVKNAVSKTGFAKKLKNLFAFGGSRFEKPPILKIVFSGAIAAASIIILMLSTQPNPIKKAGNAILDWEGKDLNNKISAVQISIKLIGNDKWRDYMKYKIKNDEWKLNIYSIDKELKKLEDEIEEESL